MKKLVSLVIAVLIVSVVLSSVAMAKSYTANCRTPAKSTVTCNKTSGTHYGKYAVSGIKPETDKDMKNSVTVEVDVKYKIKATGTEKWTGYSSGTATNVASTSKTRYITPALDEAISARGKWSVTCQQCKKSNNGSDS